MRAVGSSMCRSKFEILASWLFIQLLYNNFVHCVHLGIHVAIYLTPGLSHGDTDMAVRSVDAGGPNVGDALCS